MSYGIDSDILGFADTTLGITLQGLTNAKVEKSEAQAMDSNGDVIASTMFDTQYGHEISATYKCAKDAAIKFKDTGTGRDFRIGKVIGGFVITGMDGTTSNNDFTEVSITAQATASADSDIRKYDPDITFNGGKAAQGLAYTADTATRITGSTFTVSSSVARVQDSVGEELAVDLSAGRVEVTATLVGVTGAPGGTADTAYTLLSGASEEESNTEYATGSVTLFKNITGTDT